MIDNTCSFERMSFIDGFSGNNQIKMYLDNQKHTSFWTSLGYTVTQWSLFGLKKCLCNLSMCNEHKFSWSSAEDDGMLYWRYCIKSHSKNNHLHDLRTMFDIMRAHQLKMNLEKSFLGVSSGKFLKFIITFKEIHLDPNKVEAIQDMQPPKNLKELRGLDGRLAYIQRFIANLSGRCQRFMSLMREGISFCLGWGMPKGFQGYQTISSSLRS